MVQETQIHNGLGRKENIRVFWGWEWGSVQPILRALGNCAGTDALVIAPVLRLIRSAGPDEDMVGDEPVPDEQHNQCTDGRADKSRALIELIPADGLTNKGGHECAADPEHSCENKARWLIRSRRHKARDDARDESNHNNPDDV